MEKIIRERVFIDDMQFCFMPGRGTTNAIFILSYQKNIWLRICENLALRNRLHNLYRLCTTPEVKLESISPTVMNLELSGFST